MYAFGMISDFQAFTDGLAFVLFAVLAIVGCCVWFVALRALYLVVCSQRIDHHIVRRLR